MNNVIEKTGNLITLTASDVGKYVRIVEPGNVMIQVEMFNPVLGDTIDVEHFSLATVAFDFCEGATLRKMDRFTGEILGTYGVCTLKCIGPNEWNVFGALKPKPEWQIDLDSYPNLSWGLHPVVDIDWVTELEALEEALAHINSPGLPVITCTLTYTP